MGTGDDPVFVKMIFKELTSVLVKEQGFRRDLSVITVGYHPALVADLISFYKFPATAEDVMPQILFVRTLTIVIVEAAVTKSLEGYRAPRLCAIDPIGFLLVVVITAAGRHKAQQHECTDKKRDSFHPVLVLI